MKKAIIALVIAFLFLGSFASAQLPLPAGVPRGDVLVIENHYGTHSDPKNFNYKVPGRPGFGASGFSQVCAGFLWYINTTTSELINWLAAAPPEYSEDFKTVKIRIRKGAYWNDGTPFTAHDVVFTIKMEMEKPGFQAHYVWNSWIEDIYAEDDYTVVIKLKKPNPRFHYFLTV
ncbi:MAG: ABC transporter substrate-binding protein, partial [Thermoprotei archaeon]